MTPPAAAQAAVDEARAAGFEAEFIRGIIPFVPSTTLPTFERVKAFFDFLKTAKHVGGARGFAEGFVLEPPTARAVPLTWPYTEPEIARRYGLIE